MGKLFFLKIMIEVSLFFLNDGIQDGVLFYPHECTILIAVMNDRQ